MQRFMETDARSGTRYTEKIQAHFGVTNPDSRLQRPEFLGAKHIPLSQTQVNQTSATNVTGGATPLGETGAYSLTMDTSDLVNKSFTEHGYLIILACVRTEQSYQQNVEKH